LIKKIGGISVTVLERALNADVKRETKRLKPKDGAPFRHQGHRRYHFRCVKIDSNPPLENFKFKPMFIQSRLAQWSRDVRARDVICQCCQKCKSDVSHHLIFKSTTPALAYSLSNGIGLCYYCHDEIHYSRTVINKSSHEIWMKYQKNVS
jgi:hypothetical protein